MSSDGFEAADLSDDWIERDGEQPPTLKISIHGSLSGSVNILGDRTQKWTNVNQIVSSDLLTKKTKPLTSLFEPPVRTIEDDFEQTKTCEGLSVVEEEFSDDAQDIRADEHYLEAWDELVCEQPESLPAGMTDEKEDSDAGTIRANAPRSQDGLIPNFSFPRSNGTGSSGPDVPDQRTSSRVGDHTSRAASDPISSSFSVGDTDEARHVSNATSEPERISTPRRDPHESPIHSVSPTKSPLKLFHTTQDTFTRDHTARMIGMLSAAPAPVMQSMQSQKIGDTQKSHQSNISALSEMTDSGPERKKARKHEPKGSVTLQNFNDNADRLAAKLRAKGGGLGKGLPRLLDDNKVILGRRISSSTFDQQRKKERNNKCLEEPHNSGFEDMNLPVDQFPHGPKFGTASTKSHFSDWDSDGNTESRQFSSASGAGIDDELAAQRIKPQKIYDSIRQTWTQNPGRIVAAERASTAPTEDSPRQHVRSYSATSDVETVVSPRIKNFPPSTLESLRHGDMMFSKSRQCWVHINEDENDPFSSIGEMESQSHAASTAARHNMPNSYEEYPEEIELSSSSCHQSDIRQELPEMQHGRVGNTSRRPGETAGAAKPRQFTGPEDDEISISSDHSSTKSSSIYIREQSRSHEGPQADEDLAELTANMTMSQSTSLLVSAINKRYGEGPWENVNKIDLSNLHLDTLVGLSKFFPNLTWLDVSGNYLTSFNDLPSTLQILRASDNRISSHRVSFAHLPNLEVLDLTNNQMEDLDSIRPLIHLRHLSVNGNSLTCINGLSSLPNLMSFEAQDNMLSQVDFVHIQAYVPLLQLERVDLSHNKLVICNGIDHLEHLMELDIRSNCLKEIQVNQVMPRLKVLKASENELSDFELALVPHIRVLYLDDNQISELTAAHALRHIESLALRRQRVEHLEIDLENICDIRKLFLGGNNLKDFTLPTAFHSMKYLELAGARIHSLAPNFAEMAPNLRVLNLSNNDISNIMPLSGLNRLERLMLPNNSLTSTEDIAEVLVCLPRLKALDLRANPCTRRFYAPIATDLEVDYFANFDGVRNSQEVVQRWQMEDGRYLATLGNNIQKRREAYQNFIWTACRALRWHDGRVLESQQLLMSDEYVEGFTQESLLVTD